MLVKSENVLSFIAIVVSIISVVIAIFTSRKQNKIALFEKRIAVFEKLEEYVKNLDSWEFDYACFSKLSLTETQVKCLFDNDVELFYIRLKNASYKIDKLWGDYDFAKAHIMCNNRSESEIENEIYEIVNRVDEDFDNIKNLIYEKYLKL